MEVACLLRSTLGYGTHSSVVSAGLFAVEGQGTLGSSVARGPPEQSYHGGKSAAGPYATDCNAWSVWSLTHARTSKRELKGTVAAEAGSPEWRSNRMGRASWTGELATLLSRLPLE
jgi:hypothetical protein